MQASYDLLEAEAAKPFSKRGSPRPSLFRIDRRSPCRRENDRVSGRRRRALWGFQHEVGTMEPRTSADASSRNPGLGRGGASRGASRPPFAPPEGVQFCARRPEHAAGLFALFNERQFIEQASTRGPLANEHEVNLWLDGIIASQKFEVVAISSAKLVGFGGL